MDCKTAAAALHPYLDGELDRAAVDELERHLEQCPQCAQELAALEALRGAIKAGARRYSAPSALRERIRNADVAAANSGTADGRESTQASAFTQRAQSSRMWGMAASFAIAFVLGAGFMAWRGSGASLAAGDALEHDLFASHLRALAAASPFDVVSTDQHTVKPWFAGKVGQSPDVRDFASEGFPLLGGRIDYVGDRRVPVLVYGHGKHVIDVFVLPEAADPASLHSAERQGYRIAAVPSRGQTMYVVADVDEHELGEFLRLLGGT